MAPRHCVRVLLLVLLTSTACSPTAPTAAPPAGILVVEELGVKAYAAPNGATPSHEPWAILRETTGTHAVTIQSVIVTVTYSADSATLDTDLKTPVRPSCAPACRRHSCRHFDCSFD